MRGKRNFRQIKCDRASEKRDRIVANPNYMKDNQLPRVFSVP